MTLQPLPIAFLIMILMENLGYSLGITGQPLVANLIFKLSFVLIEPWLPSNVPGFAISQIKNTKKQSREFADTY